MQSNHEEEEEEGSLSYGLGEERGTGGSVLLEGRRAC